MRYLHLVGLIGRSYFFDQSHAAVRGKFDSTCHPVVFTDGKCRLKFDQFAWKAPSRRSLANERHKVWKFPLLDVERGGLFYPEVT